MYNAIRTHWIALHANGNNETYFDNFSVEHITKEIKRFIGNNNIITNIFRIQPYDSIICEYVCIEFVDFLFEGKYVTDFKNLFSPHDFEKNNEVILDYL